MPTRDANGNFVYSQSEYEHLNFIGERFSGFVEGIGYTCTDIVIEIYAFNASGTHFMNGINYVGYNFDMGELVSKTHAPNKTSLDFEGLEHLIGISLILLGQPIKYLKPIGALGSRPGSSIASYTLSKILPMRFTSILGKHIGSQIVKKVGTNVIGRAVGRSIPYIGWGMTAWDIGRELGQKYGGDAWVRWYREYRQEQQDKEFEEKMTEYLEELKQ